MRKLGLLREDESVGIGFWFRNSSLKRLEFHVEKFATSTLQAHKTQVFKTQVAIANLSPKDSRC